MTIIKIIIIIVNHDDDDDNHDYYVVEWMDEWEFFFQLDLYDNMTKNNFKKTIDVMYDK